MTMPRNSTLPTDVVTVGSWNIEHNGGESDGKGGGSVERRYAAYEWLAGLGPFDVFAQEMTHADRFRGRLRWEGARRLGGLPPFVNPGPTPASPNPPGLMLNSDSFWPTGVWPESKGWWHGPCAVDTRMVAEVEAAASLTIASVHLCSRSPRFREVEANLITGWMAANRAVLVMGDMNSYSGQDAGITDFGHVEDLPFREHRTMDGTTPHTEPDRIGEPETGGEGYIPLAPSKRTRSKAILGEIAGRFGGTVVYGNPGRLHLADGGIITHRPAAARPVKLIPARSPAATVIVRDTGAGPLVGSMPITVNGASASTGEAVADEVMQRLRHLQRGGGA
ncbi:MULTISPECIES: hypothetical protein [unclassified Kitasatospora]|uniref:endonuclease/exonuclease/phosphatase family protein n=1 Tax=unclassified Kitasatospora TaxID=2633591 RepID=UPI0007092CA0|nr:MULTISPECIES: hypothetical protein [unclassified Kitasatospora]KQV12037.1 hypothetical protein ASC99_34990 [Kitasatospora sp. Root107]KRB72578.1 hypothetical protein ASE03_22330 [Kitasatospora sp. Root187]